MSGKLIRWETCHLFVAAFALSSSGCLAAVVGTCAAGAGVGCNAYCKGKVCHLYTADLDDAVAAVKTALAEMGLAIQKEQIKVNIAFIGTRSGDGERIRIYLTREPNRIPADGPMTRIGVRVGTFGDHPLSERILYQISAHLVSQPQSALLSPLAQGNVVVPVTPPASVPETAPPPRPQEPPIAK